MPVKDVSVGEEEQGSLFHEIPALLPVRLFAH